MPSFILDGYNVTRGLEKFSRSKSHEEREILLDFLLRERPQGNNPVTVVFDGGPGRQGGGPVPAGLRVIFSDEASADDWIKRLVDQDKNPRNLVVVTADKALSRWVRGAKARVISPLEFVRLARPPSARKGSPDKEFDESVTEELKSLWLKKQG
jgi:predicted RNA-binding protein with PIN domain